VIFYICLITSWFEIGNGKKKLLSISFKYSYFKPIFNYTRKGLKKGTLIYRNCDFGLVHFCPKVFTIILHRTQMTQVMNLPKTKPKTIFDIGCDLFALSMAIVLYIHALHLWRAWAFGSNNGNLNKTSQLKTIDKNWTFWIDILS
jgi:hypothetical protein